MTDTDATPRHSFDVATAVHLTSASGETGPVTYAVTIDEGWTVDGKPNGGYLAAMSARAAGEALGVAGSPHRDPLATTVHFLRAPEVGDAEVHVAVLRIGRGASHARTTLIQDEQVCVEATFTVGTLTNAATPPWWTAREQFDVAPYDDCIRLPAAREGSPFVVPIMDRAEVRLDPAVLGFASGAPSGHANLRGWISLADGRPNDPLAMLFFLDALPPATFELVHTGWVPTLSLTAYVRARPAPGPLRICQRAHAVDGDRVDETCEIFDVTGRLVGQATQLAAIRIPDGTEPAVPGAL